MAEVKTQLFRVIPKAEVLLNLVVLFSIQVFTLQLLQLQAITICDCISVLK